MKIKLLTVTIFYALSINLSVFAFPQKTLPKVTQENSGKFALIVGINDYQNPSLNLNGAVPDAMAMQNLLIAEKFGFPAQNVKMLIDKDATTDKIIAEFRSHLVENAKKYKQQTGRDATIFFHYSGHGSQVSPPDFMAKKDEPDGYDETLVTYGSRDASGKNFDLRDDEIFALMNELAKYTSDAVYIFDSCNSGTINRGEGKSREIPKDTRPQPAYKILNKNGQDASLKSVSETDDFLLDSDKFVVISGTTSDSKSYEVEVEKGKFRGALTYNLELALRNATPQTTYLELMRRVSTAVNHANSNQRPQISGAKNKQIFGGKITSGEIPIPVVKVNESEKSITVGGGRFLGMREGTLLSVHNIEGKKIAEAEVTKVENNESLARYNLLSGETISAETASVKMLSPLFGVEPVKVRLELSGDAQDDNVLRAVAENLKDSNLLKTDLVSPQDAKVFAASAADVSTVTVKSNAFRQTFCGEFPANETSAAERCENNLPAAPESADGKTKLALPKDTDKVFYLAPAVGGEPIFDFYAPPDKKDSPEKIADALIKYARQKNLLALENTESSIVKNLKIELLKIEGEMTAEGFKTKSETVVEPKNIAYNFAPDTFYRLRITNQNEYEIYATALDISPDGAIYTMHPRIAQEKILPGKSVLTRLFKTSKPYGREYFKIIATKDFSDYSGLAQGNATKDVRNASNPLTRIMKNAINGSRGEPVNESPATDEWGVAELMMDVEPLK